MTEPYPAGGNLNQKLDRWGNGWALWLSKHWLGGANLFFLTYVGLPFAAPLLLANGYTGSANLIYRLYNYTCHQLPSRAYFIAGEQVCLCHRCIAIYGTIFLGGLVFALFRSRLTPLSFRAYLFFILPIGLDGGLGLVSELSRLIPLGFFWLAGLIVTAAVGITLHKKNRLTWHACLIFAAGLLGLLYVQIFGPHQSNFYLRTVTGFIFGAGTVWFAYPLMQESFAEIGQEAQVKLAGYPH